MSWFDSLLQFYFVFVVVFFLLVNLTYMAFLVLASQEILYYVRQLSFSDYRAMVRSDLTPPVSIIVPAYNEQETVVDSTRSLLELSYRNYEVIVINDGSKDDTLRRLVAEFDLYKSHQVYDSTITAKPVRGIYKSRIPERRRLVVVDKENGGKADALNVGLNLAQHDYVCCIDADSLLEEDALQKVMKPILEDDSIMAVGGMVRIANGCEVSNGRITKIGLSRKLLPTFQVVEYLRAFLSGRMFWHGMGGLLIISGAFGLFKRAAVLEVGGFKHGSLGEDMELVVRMHRIKREKKEPYRVVFVPDPVCWTQAPETVKVLSRQRNRWHRGLLDTLILHRKMILNSKYGVVGLMAMPYFVVVELLGPAIEIFGYVAVAVLIVRHAVNMDSVIIFSIASLFYGVTYSVGAVLAEEISFRRYPKPQELALLLSFGVIENFGYRQLTMWWRLKAFWDYFRGETTWGTMHRTGFGTSRANVQSVGEVQKKTG